MPRIVTPLSPAGAPRRDWIDFLCAPGNQWANCCLGLGPANVRRSPLYCPPEPFVRALDKGGDMPHWALCWDDLPWKEVGRAANTSFRRTG